MPPMPEPPVYCNLHARYDCDLCDECGHDGRDHVNAWAVDEVMRPAIFANATCWAENVCFVCLKATPPSGLRPDGHRIVHVAACGVCYPEGN